MINGATFLALVLAAGLPFGGAAHRVVTAADRIRSELVGGAGVLVGEQTAEAYAALGNPAAIEHLVAAGADGTRIRDTFHLGDDQQLELPQLAFEHTRKKLIQGAARKIVAVKGDQTAVGGDECR